MVALSLAKITNKSLTKLLDLCRRRWGGPWPAFAAAVRAGTWHEMSRRGLPIMRSGNEGVAIPQLQRRELPGIVASLAGVACSATDAALSDFAIRAIAALIESSIANERDAAND